MLIKLQVLLRLTKKLSEKRAQAVVNELVKNGVSADQVEAKGMGGSDVLKETIIQIKN
jgi:flagellar motor protein MotB